MCTYLAQCHDVYGHRTWDPTSCGMRHRRISLRAAGIQFDAVLYLTGGVLYCFLDGTLGTSSVLNKPENCARI